VSTTVPCGTFTIPSIPFLFLSNLEAVPVRFRSKGNDPPAVGRLH